jgi:hypothetical protein
MNSFDRRKILLALGACGVAALCGNIAAARTNQKWFMLCGTCRGDDRFGPKRDSSEEAEKDVQTHLKKHPGHDVAVFGPVDD